MDKKTKAWLQLIRVPNLFTVPGDPIAGFLLAGGTVSFRLPLVSLAALSLYIAGLISNDLADFKEDLQDRPNRPLPSRMVKKTHAWALFLISTCLGLIAAGFSGQSTLITALLLFALILYYNFSAKHAVGGPLIMGLCRGFSLLLGAAAAGQVWTPRPHAAAIMTSLYIASVTVIASQETKIRPIGLTRWLPPFVLLLGWGGLFFLCKPDTSIYLQIPALLSLLCAWAASRHLGPTLDPTRTPAVIGAFIRNLLCIQAALCMLTGCHGWPYGIILVLLVPVSQRVARQFYAS